MNDDYVLVLVLSATLDKANEGEAVVQMRQQVYLDSRFGTVMNGGAHLFWLQD